MRWPIDRIQFVGLGELDRSGSRWRGWLLLGLMVLLTGLLPACEPEPANDLGSGSSIEPSVEPEQSEETARQVSGAETGAETEVPVPQLKYIWRDSERDAEIVLVLLHGYGSDEEDLFPMVERLESSAGIGMDAVSFRAPVELSKGRYAWYPLQRGAPPERQHVERSAKLLHRALAWVRARATADQQVVVMGFSQGGMMAVESALRFPQEVDAAVSLSGLSPSEAVVVGASVEQPLPVLLIHGESDSRVPLAASQKTLRSLQAIENVSVELRTLPDLGHAIDGRVLAEVGVWLGALE